MLWFDSQERTASPHVPLCRPYGLCEMVICTYQSRSYLLRSQAHNHKSSHWPGRCNFLRSDMARKHIHQCLEKAKRTSCQWKLEFLIQIPSGSIATYEASVLLHKIRDHRCSPRTCSDGIDCSPQHLYCCFLLLVLSFMFWFNSQERTASPHVPMCIPYGLCEMVICTYQSRS